jgi:glycosyltransferase involved in cell wall biosynthesis
MEQSLVSVIIPTHNRAALLARAIASVRAQTYTQLEIIVVDDASSDNTRDVVAAINDGRIRYIRQRQNAGAPAARNQGIRAASGDYIAFLDDDDEWLPQKTEKQLAALRGYDVVLCSSDLATVGKRDGAPRVLGPADFRASPFAVGGTGVLMARAGVLRTTLFDETLPRCQDWDMFIRLALRYRLVYLNEPLLKYNAGQHERISNILARLSVPELEKRLVMLDKHKDFFGPYWYRRHMSGMLLYGIKDREYKIKHLLYTYSRCGFVATAAALLERVGQKLTEKWRPFKAAAIAQVRR